MGRFARADRTHHARGAGRGAPGPASRLAHARAVCARAACACTARARAPLPRALLVTDVAYVGGVVVVGL
jgi:hypothetical protein